MRSCEGRGVPRELRTLGGAVLLVLVLSLPALSVGQGAGPSALPSKQARLAPGTAPLSPHPTAGGSVGSIEVSVHNTMGIPTGTYQQPVVINSSSFASVINANWTNGAPFYTGNGSPVYGWLEANASNTSAHTLLWLNLTSIPANGWTNVTIVFWPKASFNLSATGYLGEAPELSSTYGAFDNGAKVFNFYDNFASSSLSTRWKVQGSWTYTVKNGFNVSSVPGTGGGIYTKSTFDYPAVSDFFGNLFQPATSTSFISEGLGTSGCTACGTANAVAFNSQSSSDGPTPQAGSGGSQTFGSSVSSSKQFGVFTSEAISSSKAVYELNYTHVQTLTTNIPASPLPVGLGESGFPMGALANTESTRWIRERTYLAIVPTVNISIVRYAVDFAESGLPAGSGWWVNVTGLPSAFTTNTTLPLGLPTGTYRYSVATPNKTYACPSGSFMVNEAPVLVPIRFAKVTYAITFNESGLPPGTSWALVISAGPPLVSVTPTIVVNEINGTYSYSASTSNRTYSSPTGVFTVGGAAAAVSIVFPKVVYSILFSESGLPIGTGWWVNVSGGASAFATSQNISLNESNGTYAYSVATANKVYASPTGSIAVDGLSFSVPVPFAEVTYSVTFNETGLPAGTGWSVQVVGSSAGSSTASALSLSEPNGTYVYSASRPDETYRVPSGSFVVSGAARSIPVSYLRVTSPAIFTETGLPDPTVWSVTLNGVTVSGAGNLEFPNVVNGTHAFTVGPVSGYSATPRNGSIVVVGQPSALSIAFHAVPAPGTLLGLPTVEGIAVLAGVVAAGAVVGSVVVLRRRQRTSRPIPEKPATAPRSGTRPPSSPAVLNRKGPPPRSGSRPADHP